MSRDLRRPTVTGPDAFLETCFGSNTLSFLVYYLCRSAQRGAEHAGNFLLRFLYTLYLKRHTIHNIIIGGAAAIPAPGRLDGGDQPAGPGRSFVRLPSSF